MTEYNIQNMMLVSNTLISVEERKHPYTHGHSERVSNYSRLIAQQIPGLSEEYIEYVAIGGLLHDVGKITVECHTLNNPSSRLTEDQVVELEDHPYEGVQIIRKCGVAFPDVVIDAIHSHHESWDGEHNGDLRGYPLGRAGVGIPLAGRIVAIADTYDAMTTPRPYQKMLGQAEAIAALQSLAGKKLDPELVAIFIEKVIPQLDRRKN